MTIPGDVMKAAEDAFEASNFYSLSKRETIMEIACQIHEAIMAERERCAKVAETHGRIVSNEAVGKACSRNIAEAIRKGE